MSKLMRIDRRRAARGAEDPVLVLRMQRAVLAAALIVLGLTGCGAGSGAEDAAAQTPAAASTSAAPDSAGDASTGDDSSADSNADLVSAVNATSSTTSINVKFRVEARPVVGMPVKILVAVVPTGDAPINHIHGYFAPGEGLLLQSDRNFDIAEVQAGAPLYREVTVVPQQTGVLSFSATVLLGTDKNSQTRTYSIPLIATDSTS